MKQRKRAAEATRAPELRYRRLFEAARDGILMLDPDTRTITEANPFITELLGYSRDELLGKELWEIGLLQDRAASQAAFRELHQKGYIRYEDLPLATKRGDRREVEFVSNVYEEDDHVVIQCNIRDITERKRAEEERAQLLAREQAARAAAEAAVRARDEFLATVSHDLKNPLTGIKGHAQLLLRRAARDPTRAEDNGHLAAIEARADMMRRLIDQLLDTTCLAIGQALPLQVGDVELAALVERLVEQQRMIAAEHEFILHLADRGPLACRCDADRLEQVIGNLLDNARKYSPEGGTITTTVAREDHAAGAWAVLTVADQGLGIPASDLPRVFERYHRGGNVVGQIPGMGIGLAGSRAIVEQHGGSITVESQEGAGTTVTVRLPSAPQEASSDAAAH